MTEVSLTRRARHCFDMCDRDITYVYEMQIHVKNRRTLALDESNHAFCDAVAEVLRTDCRTKAQRRVHHTQFKARRLVLYKVPRRSLCKRLAVKVRQPSQRAGSVPIFLIKGFTIRPVVRDCGQRRRDDHSLERAAAHFFAAPKHAQRPVQCRINQLLLRIGKVDHNRRRGVHHVRATLDCFIKASVRAEQIGIKQRQPRVSIRQRL
mmetsp:Transcript_3825/g.8424  ORF Transcript_3825/g.8424 Transcript_3825/m.8424 type:complete len:207 (-) Transcript_3825:165-785(-)